MFRALASEHGDRLLPVRDGAGSGQANRKEAWPLHVARYIASLSDRALQDLYAELFDPRERTMRLSL